MAKATKNVAVQTAHEIDKHKNKDGSYTLSSGVKVVLTPVPPNLLQDVVSRVKNPDVPMWFNEDKGREEPNPNDPKYLSELQEANRTRGTAMMDAIILFGMSLVDGLPSNKTWIKKLKYAGVDVDDADEFDMEFKYKKYIAIESSDDYELISSSFVKKEAVQEKLDSFRDK